MPIGTLTNVATVVVGSAVGLLLRRRFPRAVQGVIFEAVGLATLVLGVQMALRGEDFLVLIFSLTLGGILGVLVKLEERVEGLGEGVKARVGAEDARFTEGLVTAFLIFCVGSMTIVGALNEGLRGDASLLLTKAILDGFTSIALAATYGVGVLLSAVPLFLFQGSLTLLASRFQALFSELLIHQLTAVGGVLILGIGLNLLEIRRVQTVNLLPSLGIAALLTWALG
jgi:hypothetical protein